MPLTNTIKATGTAADTDTNEITVREQNADCVTNRQIHSKDTQSQINRERYIVKDT